MAQQGQIFKLRSSNAHGDPVWAYRYRLDGRGSRRPQVGGFRDPGGSAAGPQARARRAPARRPNGDAHARRAGR